MELNEFGNELKLGWLSSLNWQDLEQSVSKFIILFHTRAENFRRYWAIFLILSFSRVYMKPINLKFYLPFKMNKQKREGSLILKNWFLFFSTISKKERFKKKIKSVYSDTQIKKSELRISHSKVFSSDISDIQILFLNY